LEISSTKLTIHDLALNLRFKSKSEIEFFSEWGYLTKTPTLWNLQIFF
jgi:hypothetical protein